MRVVTYTTADTDVPEGLLAAAYVLNGTAFMPIRFNAATAADARAKAEHWLATERARASASAAGVAREERRRAAAAKTAAGDPPAPTRKRRKANASTGE